MYIDELPQNVDDRGQLADNYTFVWTDTFQISIPQIATPSLQEPVAVSALAPTTAFPKTTRAALLPDLDKATRRLRQTEYVASFIGTPQEIDSDFERAGVESWPKQAASPMKKKSGKR